MATNGQPHGHPWAGSHGRQQFCIDEAVHPDRIRIGSMLLAGNTQAQAVVRVVAIDDARKSTSLFSRPHLEGPVLPKLMLLSMSSGLLGGEPGFVSGSEVVVVNESAFES